MTTLKRQSDSAKKATVLRSQQSQFTIMMPATINDEITFMSIVDDTHGKFCRNIIMESKHPTTEFSLFHWVSLMCEVQYNIFLLYTNQRRHGVHAS